MNKFKNNFAYIDGNNLYRGTKDDGWVVDLYRFRRWLSDKFGVTRAYYFIGLIPKETNISLVYLDGVKKKIEYKKKPPVRTEP